MGALTVLVATRDPIFSELLDDLEPNHIVVFERRVGLFMYGCPTMLADLHSIPGTMVIDGGSGIFNGTPDELISALETAKIGNFDKVIKHVV